MIGIPLSAIINGERIIGPDLSEEAWADLKLQHKKGLDVIMACCGAKGHLRKSKTGLQHFYHAIKTEECGGEPESLAHLKLKYQIYQICKSEGWQAQPEYQSPSGDWRADVFAEKDGRKIVFEIQLSIIGLEELKEREEKYRRDGIESYWILKDFLKFFPYDNSKVVSDSNRGVFIDTYLNEAEFILDREQDLLIRHGVRTIGIDLESNCLYTAEILGIGITEWIKVVLKGEYEKYLTEFETHYRNKLRLKKIARPELKKLSDINDRKFEYDEQMKKFYAIFKNNKWDDHRSMQQDIHEMYDSFKKFNEARGKIVSPRNGFVWKDYMHLGREQPLLNLISDNQIDLIHNQLLNVEAEEKKFLSVINCIKQLIEQKIPEKNDRMIELFCTPKPEDQEPDHYRNKKLFRKQLQKEKDPVSSEKVQPKRPTSPPPTQNAIVGFEFSPILPSIWIESQRGWKYQNPAGCTWEINKGDALEFEMKGYGKIIQN